MGHVLTESIAIATSVSSVIDPFIISMVFQVIKKSGKSKRCETFLNCLYSYFLMGQLCQLDLAHLSID